MVPVSIREGLRLFHGPEPVPDLLYHLRNCEAGAKDDATFGNFGMSKGKDRTVTGQGLSDLAQNEDGGSKLKGDFVIVHGGRTPVSGIP